VNQQKAIKHVRALTAQARRDWQTKRGKPMPEMGVTDRHREINDQLRAALLISALQSGCSKRDADRAVLCAIQYAATMIETGSMDTSGELITH